MTVEERIQAILIATPAVTSLVPADRIRVGGSWQNMTAPYMVHFPVAWVPMRTHEGIAGLQNCGIYQLSVFGAKYSAARLAATQIIQALDGHHSEGTAIFWRGGPRYLHDDEVNLDYFVLEFSVFASLS